MGLGSGHRGCSGIELVPAFGLDMAFVDIV
jgi:hypothetical protein